MRYNRNRAIVILLASVLILLATSLYITPASVSDTDPSTYVIVPLLMLPFFVLFSFKADLQPEVGRSDALIGIVAFVLFLLLTILLRFYFSFYFVSFRLDMLLMPLGIVALVSLLLGVKNVSKFKAVMFYSLLASPAILYPIISMYNSFIQFNTLLVYNVIKLFIGSVKYIAPITISANGYVIGIGQACVSIGIFIALALFLIPIAYLYNGRGKNKIYWVASGIVLLFVFNTIRMLSISFVWLAYGPNSTALLIHTFIGVILFYLIIVLMLLASKFYGLDLNPAKKRKKPANRSSGINASYVIAALAFSLIYFYLTLNYYSALAVSPISLASRTTFNYNNTQISTYISNLINKSNFTSFFIANQKGTYAAFSLWNKTISSSNPIGLIATYPNKKTTDNIVKNNTLLGELNFFSNKGTTEQVFDVVSQGTEYLVYYTNVPFVFQNLSSTITSIYILIPLSALPKVMSCSTYDPIYSGILDLINPTSYNQTKRQRIIAAECVSNKIVWA